VQSHINNFCRTSVRSKSLNLAKARVEIKFIVSPEILKIHYSFSRCTDVDLAVDRISVLTSPFTKKGITCFNILFVRPILSYQVLFFRPAFHKSDTLNLLLTTLKKNYNILSLEEGGKMKAFLIIYLAFTILICVLVTIQTFRD